MQNKLTDLNNYLFESLERLTDDSLTDEQMERERKRAAAINNTAKVIIDNGRLALDAMEFAQEYGEDKSTTLFLLENKECDNISQKKKMRG